ncbi:MAG: hypothetical protein N3A66_03660 [Planctomycetota bacterium]|nr:hypothetical protein [Planctomycetota bacterium]
MAAAPPKPAPVAVTKAPSPPPPPAPQVEEVEEPIEEAPEEVPEEVEEEKAGGEVAAAAEEESKEPAQEEEEIGEEKSAEEEAEEAEEKGEEEQEGAEVVAPAPKSWVGRILILAGAACIIAGLFLPWALPNTLKSAASADASSASSGASATDQPKEPSTHGLIEEDKTKETEQKGDKDKNENKEGPEAAPPEGESVGWRNSDLVTVVVTGEESSPATGGEAGSGTSIAGAVGPKGLEIPKMFSAMPIFYAIYGLAGAAVLLALLALLPGVILKGGLQKIVGLILSLACIGLLGAILFALNKTAAEAGGLTALFGQHQLGLILTVAGAAACFLGGLICTFGVFGAAVAAAPSRGRLSTRSTVRMLPRRPESPAEGETAPVKPPSKIKPPLRPASSRAASAPLRPPASARKPAAPAASGPRPSARTPIAPKPPLRPPPKGGAAPSARKK